MNLENRVIMGFERIQIQEHSRNMGLQSVQTWTSQAVGIWPAMGTRNVATVLGPVPPDMLSPWAPWVNIWSNTSFFPRHSRHSQNPVNYVSFWHSWKAQLGDLCDITQVILNPIILKPYNLKSYSKPCTLNSKNIQTPWENEGQPLNTKHLNPNSLTLKP